MIVVADVYGNGRASLAEIVEAPRNRRMVEELQDRAAQEPGLRPRRARPAAQTMRVVFVLQKMNVGDGQLLSSKSKVESESPARVRNDSRGAFASALIRVT
jgi:hypothetical protein